MNDWSKPIARFFAVMLVMVLTLVALFYIYVAVGIGTAAGRYYLRSVECPDFSTYTLPKECLVHMGDWIRGEENDGKSDFVWHGTESDLNVCVQAFEQKQEAEFDDAYDANSECWDRYGESDRLTGYNAKMEYQGRLLDDTDMRIWGFVTPTPSP